MECQIGVISGDGIGPEIVTEAKKVQATVHFFYYGQELETRTSTLSLEGAVEKTLTTDKDT